MMNMQQLLRDHAQVSDYKINIHKKESYELFFVKSKLETVRCTDTCDTEVTVYVDHDEFKGDAQFFVYPSTTEEQAQALIDEAVAKALMLNNKKYELPAGETGAYVVESNFAAWEPAELAAKIAGKVFAANTIENASLNAVEIFINKHTENIVNSKGLNKTQTKYDAMVEAIPTYNGETQSVELYEQYNFAALDEDALFDEIADKMRQVKARYEAVKPESIPACKVILDTQEVSELLGRIAYDLNYSSVYMQANLFKKGDDIQKQPTGDLIGLEMHGALEGSVASNKFDSDGLKLDSVRIVDGGKAVSYYGNNRFGQYLGEEPTGSMRCVKADAGSLSAEEIHEGAYLEVLSMSGLQVDFYSDYIGGEVRLAYLNDGEKTTPVTGISISGKLSEVLSSIRFAKETALYGNYVGPKQAVLTGMSIF